MKIILTGPIGSGKSTVARHIMAQLDWRQPAGFFTRKDSTASPAPTLVLETWQGVSRVFAQMNGAPSSPDSPPYKVVPEVFNHFAVECLKTAAGNVPVVVDELGVLELNSEAFGRAMAALFQCAGPILVVIQERALERWRKIIGQENIDHVFTVESGNRDKLSAQIVALFRGR